MIEADVELVVTEHPGIHPRRLHQIEHGPTTGTTDLELHQRSARHHVAAVQDEDTVIAVLFVQSSDVSTDGCKPADVRLTLDPVRTIRLIVSVQVVRVRDDQLSRAYVYTCTLWGHGVLQAMNPKRREISLLARAIKSSTSDWAIGPSIR